MAPPFGHITSMKVGDVLTVTTGQREVHLHSHRIQHVTNLHGGDMTEGGAIGHAPAEDDRVTRLSRQRVSLICPSSDCEVVPRRLPDCACGLRARWGLATGEPALIRASGPALRPAVADIRRTPCGLAAAL